MLREKLLQLSQSDEYPFHMPGHKRNFKNSLFKELNTLDITEITGFDDLHNPDGIIQDLENRAAIIYHCAQAYALVQGSTVGIQVAISALCPRGSKILIQRNSHMSVYNTAYLLGLKVEYLWGKESDTWPGIWLPDYLKELEEKLIIDSEIKTVLITDPDYLGIQIDIERVISICRKYNCYLIIDSAHGAHLQFDPSYRWIEKGADAVIVSLHKTLPALTQTALLLTSDRVSKEAVRAWIDVFETSSPSYLLLASIEEALDFIELNDWDLWKDRLKVLRSNLRSLRNIHLIESKDIEYQLDESKVVLYIEGQGNFLKTQLRNKFHLELEMTSSNYCLAMTSPVDSKGGYERLIKGLKVIDESIEEVKKSKRLSIPIGREAKYSLEEAGLEEKEWIDLSDSEDRVCAQMVIAYPPGVPVLVPGEVISQKIIKYIQSLIKQEVQIRGIHNQRIKVISKRGYHG